MSKISIDVFTDPTCPFAYSLEPVRWRLKWLYGDALAWNDRMIILSGFDGETSPMTPELISASRERLRDGYNMPINISKMPRVPQSYLVSKNYIAIKTFAPKLADTFLRNLRIASMDNALIDEQKVIDEVITQSGLNASDVHNWLDDSSTLDNLNSDAKAARTPGKNALHFSRKLSTTSTGVVRYPASSFVFTFNGQTQELPGFWPLEAYEAIIGNLAPAVRRRDEPTSAEEVLAWAQTPLATAEVAMIMNTDFEEARAELVKIAEITPVGQDGFWRYTENQK